MIQPHKMKEMKKEKEINVIWMLESSFLLLSENSDLFAIAKINQSIKRYFWY